MSDIVQRLLERADDSDNQELDREAAAEIERLRAVLESLRRPHYMCDDDCWYSCPKSGECCDDDAPDRCICGADEHNAKIDAALVGPA